MAPSMWLIITIRFNSCMWQICLIYKNGIHLNVKSSDFRLAFREILMKMPFIVLVCLGINQRCSVTSVRFLSTWLLAFPTSPSMERFCCSSFRYACIIRHFTRCFHIRYKNWVAEEMLNRTKSLFAILYVFITQRKGMKTNLSFWKESKPFSRYCFF